MIVVPARTRTRTRFAGPRTLRRPRLERGLDLGADLRRVGRPAGGRRGRVGEHEQPVRDRGARARRAHDLDVGRLRVAARERVDGRARALRVALHELVDALGDEQVGERVDGVVERRAARRRSPGPRALESAGSPRACRTGSWCRPSAFAVDARRASAGAGRARRRRCSPAAPPTRAAGSRAARPAAPGRRPAAAVGGVDLGLAGRRPAGRARSTCAAAASLLAARSGEHGRRRSTTAWLAAATCGSRLRDHAPRPLRPVAPGQDRREAAGGGAPAQVREVGRAPTAAARLSESALACAASSCGCGRGDLLPQRRRRRPCAASLLLPAAGRAARSRRVLAVGARRSGRARPR